MLIYICFICCALVGLPPAESPLLFIASYCLVGHAPKLRTLCQDRARHRHRHREDCPAFHPALACPMCLQCHAPIPANVLQLGAKQQNHLMPATSRHFTFFFLFFFLFFLLVKSTANAKGKRTDRRQRQTQLMGQRLKPKWVRLIDREISYNIRERNIQK